MVGPSCSAEHALEGASTIMGFARYGSIRLVCTSENDGSPHLLESDLDYARAGSRTIYRTLELLLLFDLGRFMEEVRDHGDRFEITAKDAANIWKVNGDRYDRYERKFSDNIIGSGKSFWGLIYSYSDTQCFNLRDKIYAVMSLERSDPSLSPIPVDYTIDMDELFWRIMVLRPVTTPLHGPFARIGTLAAALSLDASSLSKIRTKLEGGTDGIDPQSDWGGQLRRFLDSDDSDSDNST